MIDFFVQPSLIWFGGSLVVLFLMAVHRMFSPRNFEPYVVWSREYWEDGFYILLAWPGYLILLGWHVVMKKPFRHG